MMPVEERDLIEVRGSDRVRFLQNYCTADVTKIDEGTAAEAFFPTDKGRILAHGLIINRGDNSWISGYAGLSEALLPHLSKYAVFDDVELKDNADAYQSFLVVGVGAAEHVASKLGDVADATSYSVNEAITGSSRVYVATDSVETVRDTLALPEGTTDEAEAARIMAGVPRVGVDVSDKNLVQEAARTPLAVSFTKGCYLGQEPIARLDAMGHTNRELRTISLDDRRIGVGDEVMLDERTVGNISSFAFNGGSESVALAMLRTAACEPGTDVRVGDATGVVLSGTETLANRA